MLAQLRCAQRRTSATSVSAVDAVSRCIVRAPPDTAGLVTARGGGWVKIVDKGQRKEAVPCGSAPCNL